MKVKKGWLAIQVGLEEEDGGIQKIVIPISYLYHPLLQKLLDKAHDVYGYHVDGPLKLPCSVDDFLHIRHHLGDYVGYDDVVVVVAMVNLGKTPLGGLRWLLCIWARPHLWDYAGYDVVYSHCEYGKDPTYGITLGMMLML
ncbi:hypothetical protein MTR67_025109 [Solanum verrucosum]|uniref:Uncharacterized protein n=1 Tax=Solanum verrucosum TaxID=315347 RepID=A0AAF0QWJ5_SOLVR|nr:hypothetical protein MTR67_025109 [Solanum verrucosum]